MDMDAFEEFTTFLEGAFPLVHRRLEWERVSELGRLYRLPGTEEELDPVLFLAHYDVVPPGDETAWSHPPFSGDIADGYIWGRGALDDKGVLVAILEALERRLEAGFSPQRGIYLALGGDEEVSGTQGAARIAATLARRGLHFCAVFDEGMVVAHRMLPFLGPPAALVGIAEKGYADVRLTAETGGGHAAMPPVETAISLLAGAIRRAIRPRRRDRLHPVVADFFRVVAHAVGSPLSFVLRYPRLFAPLLVHILARSATTRALVRTTVAPTVIQGGEASNVLPPAARVVLNCRLLPGHSVEELLTELGKAVSGRHGENLRVELHNPKTACEPVEASSTEAEGYHWLVRAIHAEFPDAVQAPFLVTGTTDSRHYREIAENIYRFVPLELDPEALSTIHSTDERIAVAGYERAISFYERLLGYAGGGSDE
jgi:carboxypeptidase PM20D1